MQIGFASGVGHVSAVIVKAGTADVVLHIEQRMHLVPRTHRRCVGRIYDICLSFRLLLSSPTISI